jgi:hypothetical protein
LIFAFYTKLWEGKVVRIGKIPRSVGEIGYTAYFWSAGVRQSTTNVSTIGDYNFDALARRRSTGVLLTEPLGNYDCS